MKRMTFLVAIAVIAAAPLSAQGISGTWFTEFERQMRNQDGVVSGGDKIKAKITLAQKGDSLIGTWEIVPASGQPTPPARPLRGAFRDGKGTLVSEFDARRNINGEESVAKVTVIYDFTVSGDKLEGTSKTRSSDMEMPSPPFSAWREKQ